MINRVDDGGRKSWLLRLELEPNIDVVDWIGIHIKHGVSSVHFNVPCHVLIFSNTVIFLRNISDKDFFRFGTENLDLPCFVNWKTQGVLALLADPYFSVNDWSWLDFNSSCTNPGSEVFVCVNEHSSRSCCHSFPWTSYNSDRVGILYSEESSIVIWNFNSQP